jgi:hypothetical protein
MPGGGLAASGRWRNCRKGFFLPVRVLSKVFRGKLLRQFECAFADRDDQVTRQILIDAARKPWVVYSKPPTSGPEQVLKYLGRYTQRTAISNTRIQDYRDGRVIFRYRDRTDANRSKTMTLAAPEFLRRILLHVLPKGFVRIRHYGFLANPNRAQAIAHCLEQLGEKQKAPVTEIENWQALLYRLTGLDLTRCPSCKVGQLFLTGYITTQVPKWSLFGRATSP